jgi:PhzF family phenazine biosynthesis protein
MDGLMDIQRFKCFGTDPSSGNEALVIFDDATTKWSTAERQRFASEQKANACVFINQSEDGMGPYTLDFYYPHIRSPLCLHASLAAAHYLQTRDTRRYRGSALTVVNRQLLRFSRSGNELNISVLPSTVQTPVPNVTVIAGWLGCAPSSIKTPPSIASVGSPKLLVEMPSRQALYALRPNLNRICEWGKAAGVSGLYAYAHQDLNRYEGRNFNHLDEALEDAATGVAAGALSAHLGMNITLYQGAMLGNSCEINAHFRDGSIIVGGRVFEA